MFDQLLLKTKTPSLDCNMESLMSELRHQYTAAAAAAAAATTAVSQAMLLQAMNQHHTIQTLKGSSPSQQTVVAPRHRQQQQQQQRRQADLINSTKQQQAQAVPASHSANSPTLTRNALGQSAPLDLSVKTRPQLLLNQTARSRLANGVKCHHSRKPQLDLTAIQAQLVIQVNSNGVCREGHTLNGDSNSNNQLSAKLITSSMSPTSMAVDEQADDCSHNDDRLSASSTRVISSSSPGGDDDDDGRGDNHERAQMPATDVISSTNGRRLRRQVGARKQKTSRSHLCNHCGRSFARSDMLTRHSRVHSGLKPFQCGECSQGFSRSDHLSTHQRTHTGEKPYQCDMCDYSACRRDMITRHMRTHSAQRGKRTRVRARKASNSTASTSSRLSNSDRNRIRRNTRANKYSASHRETIGGQLSASMGIHHDTDKVFIPHHQQ